MKLADHTRRKVTEPNFSGKIRFGPNLGILAKMARNCPKMDLFENITKLFISLVFSSSQN